jgi:PhnB protein
MPLERAPWGDLFGMCADKFGVNWLVNIAAPRPRAADHHHRAVILDIL